MSSAPRAEGIDAHFACTCCCSQTLLRDKTVNSHAGSPQQNCSSSLKTVPVIMEASVPKRRLWYKAAAARAHVCPMMFAGDGGLCA